MLHGLDLFKAGLHIVAANSRAKAQPLRDGREHRIISNFDNRGFLYETNVCASPSVIESLQYWLKNGARFHEFTAVISGTLSCVCGLEREKGVAGGWIGNI
jgi:homoserine dehydrogenase